MNAEAILAAADERLGGLQPLPFHLPVGRLKPVVAGAWSAMAADEWVVTGLRERVGAVLRGCPVEDLRDPAAGARPWFLAPASGAPGVRALHAVGIAMATGKPVLCFLGLASVATGSFHEALNAATLVGAHVIFLVEAQTLTDDAPVGRQLAARPVALATAFGTMGARVEATFDAVRDAVAEGREAEGPALVEVTIR